MVFDRSEIAVEDYPKWRAWVQRVDALMHEACAWCRLPRSLEVRREPPRAESDPR